MVLPVNFGSLAAGKQNLSLYDTQFAAVEPLITTFSAPITGDLAINALNTVFTVVQVAQGTVGVFFAIGTVTIIDSTAGALFGVRLWDGTTIGATTEIVPSPTPFLGAATLAAVFTNPAGNIRISVQSGNSTGGVASGTTGLGRNITLNVLKLA